MADVRRAVLCLGAVLAFGATAGACGGAAPSPAGTRSSTAPPSTAPPGSGSADHSVPTDFVGTWYVHGGVMTIDADGNGTQVFSSGTFGETDTVTFVVQDGGQMLVGTIRRITDAEASGTITDPDPADAQAVGDTFSLVHSDADVLDKAYRTSALPAEDRRASNPNLCGPGLGSVPEADRQRCGVG